MNPYIGRFAPSPTGPLHIGSLFTALCSYLDARAHGGKWLLRIEDVDPPREQPEAVQRIIQSLKSHGLRWDDEIVFQSQRSHLYEKALSQLIAEHHCFACPCSRKEMAALGRHRDDCPIPSSISAPLPYALKLRASKKPFFWEDIFLSAQHSRLEEDTVLKRKDHLYAYQLAVVCDDIQQGVTHVLRGSDLIESTPAQLLLYKLLSHKAPYFGHLPLVINVQGQKLSKQNYAPALVDADAVNNLKQIGSWLGFELPNTECTEQILQSYTHQWCRKALRRDFIQVAE